MHPRAPEADGADDPAPGLRVQRAARRPVRPEGHRAHRPGRASATRPPSGCCEHLLLSKESKGRKGSDRGFISYAELGINQLGAVYEGLMSYTGFFADEDLYEVAKNGDPEKGSWVVPVTARRPPVEVGLRRRRWTRRRGSRSRSSTRRAPSCSGSPDASASSRRPTTRPRC